ncbi:hypothetical protein ACHAWU_007550 [Discostella pseudostelligera]|uniref:Uncharacterized protein n=1 Tax=Discostella pseudostelligera TaxID=259834 RepID=A0ABD3MAL8_9STRA
MWSASLLQRHLNKLHTLLESHWHEGGLHLKQSFILNSPSSSERKRTPQVHYPDPNNLVPFKPMMCQDDASYRIR